MPILVGVLLLVVALLIGGALLGVALNLIWYLLVGLVIGAGARLLVPDTAGMSLVATSLYGVGGALIGGMVADEVFDWGLLGSILLSIGVAAILIAVFSAVASRGDRASAP